MYLGIDIGTGKAAAVLVDGSGEGAAAECLPHGADRPAPPGRSEQDPEVLLESAWACVRRLPAGGRARVRGIGVTGQMHGVALLDAEGRFVSPLFDWRDGRCLEADFLERLRRATGRRLRTGCGCATLAWLSAAGLLPGASASASAIQDCAVSRLCGSARPVTDPTDAASFGLFDAIRGSWEEEAVRAAGIPRRLLPEVVPGGSRAGFLSGRMAEALGLPEGVPVAAALGDNQASLMATLREPERELALTLGTGGQLSAVMPASDRLRAPGDGDPFELRPYPGGLVVAVAAALCGGSAWKWLADSAASWSRALGLPELPPDAVFAALNRLGLEAGPGPEVRPHFLGERHDPGLRGSIHGIDLGNFTLGGLARGLAEGICSTLRDMLPPQAREGRVRVRASGNALRRNPLLLSSAERAFGVPVILGEAREEAAVGAALMALRAGARLWLRIKRLAPGARPGQHL